MFRPPFAHIGVAVVLVALLACSDSGIAVVGDNTDAALSARTIPTDYVSTPVGYIHKSCDSEIEEGATVYQNLRVVRKDGTSYQIAPCSFPVIRLRTPGEKRGGGNYPLAAADCQKWVECAVIEAPSGNWYKAIYANWTVPPLPTAPYNAVQQLYYAFPGLQWNVGIHQPVMQLGVNGGFGSETRWLITAYHCSTTGLYSTNCQHGFRQLVDPGDNISGSVVGESCGGGYCTYKTSIRDLTHPFFASTVSFQDNTLNNAVGGAIETYNLYSCGQYPAGGVRFRNIQVLDKDGVQVHPAWETFNNPASLPHCNFFYTVNESTVLLAQILFPQP